MQNLTITLLLTFLIATTGLFSQTDDLFFHNPTTNGFSNQVGYSATYQDVAVVNGRVINAITTVVAASAPSYIDNFTFTSDSGHDFRFNLRDNNVAVNDSVWATILFEFFDALTGEAVNVGTKLNFDNISETTKAIEKVEVDPTELYSYAVENPTNLLINNFTFSGSTNAGNNGLTEQAVAFTYLNRSSFSITLKMIKKKVQSTTQFFRVDGNDELIIFENKRETINPDLVSLPLTLVSFEAAIEGEQVEIEWITEEEEDLSHFEIEKSENGQVFKPVEIISAKGQDAGRNYYNTTDYQLNTGATYYRLKSVDYDGTTYYSEIKVVEYKSNNNYEINVFPNPVSDRVNIKATNTIGSVTIFDMMGRVVRNVNSNANFATIHVSDLVKGQYIISINFEDNTIAKQALIIQ